MGQGQSTDGKCPTGDCPKGTRPACIPSATTCQPQAAPAQTPQHFTSVSESFGSTSNTEWSLLCILIILIIFAITYYMKV